MSFELQAAVGLNDDGSFCPNHTADQQIVAELLLMIPLPAGGLKSSLGPVIDLPPITEGAISGELVGAIQTFQTVHDSLLNIDLRVDVGGATWALLVELASVPAIPVLPVANVVLDPVGEVLEEAPPAPVSGLPSIVYTPASIEQLLFDDGRVRVVVSFSGILTGSWGQSFGLACVSSPALSALDQAVKSGDARRIGGTALDQACHELRAQTRFAANQLFSAVSISSNIPGVFKVSGSMGDQWRQVSIGFEFPNTIVATGSVTISKSVPLTTLGGDVLLSGTLACTIKAMLRDPIPPDEASVGALIAVLIVGGVLVSPAAAWIAEAASVQLARQVVRQSAQGLLRELVLLGPSPSL
jgi:hypothetical protein